jgi:hypothetical protein
MKGIGKIWVDNGADGEGVELNEEGIEIFSEVLEAPDLKITDESLTFKGYAGSSELESENLIFFDNAYPPAQAASFYAEGIDFTNGDAVIQFNNANYGQLNVELRATELRLGQSRFLSVDSPALSETLYEDFVNTIVAISNIDYIEFYRNNSSNTQINRLCTSTDVGTTGYPFSDNHVI